MLRTASCLLPATSCVLRATCCFKQQVARNLLRWCKRAVTRHNRTQVSATGNIRDECAAVQVHVFGTLFVADTGALSVRVCTGFALGCQANADRNAADVTGPVKLPRTTDKKRCIGRYRSNNTQHNLVTRYHTPMVIVAMT